MNILGSKSSEDRMIKNRNNRFSVHFFSRISVYGCISSELLAESIKCGALIFFKGADSKSDSRQAICLRFPAQKGWIKDGDLKYCLEPFHHFYLSDLHDLGA